MDTVCIEKKILNPLKWTAETPNLYDLIIETRVGGAGAVKWSGRY